MTSGDDGRKTRRTLLRAGLAVVGATAALQAEARVAPERMAQDKIAQKMVQYQETPKEGQKCSLCVNWEAPNACKIVAGTINPEGWCIAFAPKSS